MLPAPGTFSTITGWPTSSDSRAAMMRAEVSTGPPAANGTTMVTGRVGQSCARAATGLVSAMASAAAISFRMMVLRNCADRSFHADAGRLDDLAPALDLLRQVLGEVFG